MRVRHVALLLAIVLAFAGVAIAQETTGTIKGRIVDAQGLPTPGVTVTVIGPQGSKTAVTDSDGRYNIPFLTPGLYRIRAELEGFKALEHPNATVSLGATLDVPFRMELGGVAETVTVIGVPTVVDTTSTTTGAIVSSDLLQKVPMGRRMTDTLYMAPGVSSGGSVGEANPSISGGSGLDNQYVVDGVNVTNQGYGAVGSYSIYHGSLGTATPFDFVKEVQVKTGGYEAEFGQSMGGVVNVVTKSGSNVIRGSLFGYTRPDWSESDWTQYQTLNGTIQTLGTRNWDAGAEGGGPIMKDRAFFFGAIDPSYTYQTFQAPDGFPLYKDGGYDRERRNISYAAKGTVQLTNSHRIDASFFGDPSKGFMGAQRMSSLLRQTTSSFSELTYGGHNQTVRYDGVMSSKWLVEAVYARALNSLNELPSVDSWSVTDYRVTPNIVTGGIGFYEGGNKSINNQFLVKSTNILGDHQVRYGFEYNDVTYSQINQRTGPTFVGGDGRTTATGAQVSVLPMIVNGNLSTIWRVTRANYNSDRTTLQKYFNFFVQDSWKASDRLTVNGGLRYEQEKLAGTIVTDFMLKNNWGPRIGATFDPLGDAKTKVYGNYGRFFARIPNDLAARALSADDGISRGDYYDAGLTRPIPLGVPTIDPATGTAITNHFVLSGVSADTIDPNAKLSYVDEIIGGFEREIMANTTVGVRYIYRNIGRTLEDVANCPMVAYETNPTPCKTVEYILTNPTSATPINAALLAETHAYDSVKFDDVKHTYHAVEFTVNRRMSNNWSALASYRWSRLRGNYDGFYRDDNGQSDPGITSLYDFPTNDPTYASIGVPVYGYSGDIRYQGTVGMLPLDRPHQVKLFGNYAWPMGLNVGVGFTAVTGKPLTPLAANPNYDNSGEIPTAERGSGIQTVHDGFQTRTPFMTQVDAQASYALGIGGNRRITLLADVFNLFDQKTVLDYDTFTELGFQIPNPDFGTPTSQNVQGPQYQAPRQIRFGVRFEF